MRENECILVYIPAPLLYVVHRLGEIAQQHRFGGRRTTKANTRVWVYGKEKKERRKTIEKYC